MIENLETGAKKTFFGTDSDGIGSIAVHPNKKFYAIAEKGDYPSVYIYDYLDSNRLYRVLRRGTEKAYAHICFSSSGGKLATVGSAPDFTLTVWDWISQKVILKTKASSQDIFRVAFSPLTDGTLITSGLGHIKFWKMAQTFTGLKLQGEIAKFGQLELSDVTGFVELPDGKVLSGTESGTLILWEGNNVKAHLVSDIKEKTGVHVGMVEIILFENEEFITTGEDGMIKFWDFNEIDSAEFDEVIEVKIEPKRVISMVDSLGEPCFIKAMEKAETDWLIQDARGGIY